MRGMNRAGRGGDGLDAVAVDVDGGRVGRRRLGAPSWGWVAVATWLVAGCDCGGSTQTGSGAACRGEGAPAECGSSCADGGTCGPGLYCGAEGQCTADCAPGRVECPEGFRCTGDGICVAEGDDAGRGEMARDGAAPDGAARDGTVADGRSCPSIDVVLRRTIPTVVLIVDRSGSMNDHFEGERSRWDVLYEALMGSPDGLVTSLQSVVRFGLVLYTGSDRSDVCPILDFVDPALDNRAVMDAVYGPARPLEDTPTGDAVDAVLMRYASLIGDPDRTEPVIFVLATDGEPDRCEQLDPNPTPEAQAEAVEAVRRAYERGVPTYLIDVGNGVGPAHKQDVANAGAGVGPGDPPAPYWTVTDDRGLREALRSIVGGALSCELNIDGRLADPDEACASGTVRLNGRELSCGDADGWRVVDPERIELLGTACEEFLGSPVASIQARFDCGVVLL